MTMNKYMHPRNPYKKPPDFMQMTLDYPDLRKFVKPDLSGKIKMNFKCDGAVRELTKCLLHKDFGLTIDLPPNRLVPTLPLRMNYLLWIEDLLNEPGRQLIGIDIGTGASCIYPLLAVKHFNWMMTATEINEESVRYAVQNVQNNKLTDFIKVKRVENSIMLVGALEDEKVYDFCMCNPPFFSDETELQGKMRTDRRAPPRNHRTGQDFELIAPGGETTFITRIIQDSVKLKSKIRVFTVMVGHKSNLNKVRELVKKINPIKMRTTEFCQGRTTRWGLAWTFSDDSNLISTAMQMRKDQSKPPYRWIYPDKVEISDLRETILQILNDLRITSSIIENEDDNCGISLKAFENTWCHSRRKRREEKRKQVDNEVASPCDSVVTVNSSVDSSHHVDPSSPTDSLGYSSVVEIDDELPNSNEPSQSRDNRMVFSTIHSKINQNINFQSSSNIQENRESIIEHNECLSSIYKDDSLINLVKNNTDSAALIPCSSDNHENEVEPHISSNADTKVSEVSSRKRKLDDDLTPSNIDSKRIKRNERPLLESVLSISLFDDDIVLSLSFIDGTGGRDSANQVFQYLKNKLISQLS